MTKQWKNLAVVLRWFQGHQKGKMLNLTTNWLNQATHAVITPFYLDSRSSKRSNIETNNNLTQKTDLDSRSSKRSESGAGLFPSLWVSLEALRLLLRPRDLVTTLWENISWRLLHGQLLNFTQLGLNWLRSTRWKKQDIQPERRGDDHGFSFIGSPLACTACKPAHKC